MSLFSIKKFLTPSGWSFEEEIKSFIFTSPSSAFTFFFFRWKSILHSYIINTDDHKIDLEFIKNTDIVPVTYPTIILLDL